MPKHSAWRVAQFDTLRLRLVKIAARVVEMKTQVRLHLPSACPYRAILRTVAEYRALSCEFQSVEFPRSDPPHQLKIPRHRSPLSKRLVSAYSKSAHQIARRVIGRSNRNEVNKDG
jgi:hypothetical protein